MKRIIVSTGIAALLLGALTTPARAILFGSIPNGSGSDLVIIDQVTGAATEVGAIGFKAVKGLAVRPSDGTMFASTGYVTGGANVGKILTVNTMSGGGTALPSQDLDGITALAFSPGGTLYATCRRFNTDHQPDVLCTINQLDGSATPVDQFQALDPNFLVEGFDGLAFDSGGTLYASTNNFTSGEPRLYTVNTATGVATVIGPIRTGGGVQLSAGVVDIRFLGSTLFGATSDGRIITIDKATGIYTVVGPTGLGNAEGLAELIVNTPTPTIPTPPTGTAPPTATPTPKPCAGKLAPVNPCAPGRGSKKTDCFMEWLVTPVPGLDRKGLPVKKVICYEGDPACDIDTNLGNKECTFQAQICLNNNDPRFPECQPLDITSFEVRKPNPDKPKDATDTANAATLEDQAANGFGITVVRKKVVVSLESSDSTPDDCSPPLPLRVPLKVTSSGKIRKFHKTFRIRGTTSLPTRPNVDTDVLNLECRPSTCGNGIVESDHEECDDGNRDAGDGCDPGCHIEPTPVPTNTPASTDTSRSHQYTASGHLHEHAADLADQYAGGLTDDHQYQRTDQHSARYLDAHADIGLEQPDRHGGRAAGAWWRYLHLGALRRRPEGRADVHAEPRLQRLQLQPAAGELRLPADQVQPAGSGACRLLQHADRRAGPQRRGAHRGAAVLRASRSGGGHRGGHRLRHPHRRRYGQHRL